MNQLLRPSKLLMLGCCFSVSLTLSTALLAQQPTNENSHQAEKEILDELLDILHQLPDIEAELTGLPAPETASRSAEKEVDPPPQREQSPEPGNVEFKIDLLPRRRSSSLEDLLNLPSTSSSLPRPPTSGSPTTAQPSSSNSRNRNTQTQAAQQGQGSQSTARREGPDSQSTSQPGEAGAPTSSANNGRPAETGRQGTASPSSAARSSRSNGQQKGGLFPVFEDSKASGKVRNQENQRAGQQATSEAELSSILADLERSILEQAAHASVQTKQQKEDANLEQSSVNQAKESGSEGEMVARNGQNNQPPSQQNPSAENKSSDRSSGGGIGRPTQRKGASSPGYEREEAPRRGAVGSNNENDDIIARQLKEAAMAETDPELRKKLLEEYNKYKRL